MRCAALHCCAAAPTEGEARYFTLVPPNSPISPIPCVCFCYCLAPTPGTYLFSHQGAPHSGWLTAGTGWLAFSLAVAKQSAPTLRLSLFPIPILSSSSFPSLTPFAILTPSYSLHRRYYDSLFCRDTTPALRHTLFLLSCASSRRRRYPRSNFLRILSPRASASDSYFFDHNNSTQQRSPKRFRRVSKPQ